MVSSDLQWFPVSFSGLRWPAVVYFYWNSLQTTGTHCKPLDTTADYWKPLQVTGIYCKSLQITAVCTTAVCKSLQSASLQSANHQQRKYLQFEVMWALRGLWKPEKLGRSWGALKRLWVATPPTSTMAHMGSQARPGRGSRKTLLRQFKLARPLPLGTVGRPRASDPVVASVNCSAAQLQKPHHLMK